MAGTERHVLTLGASLAGLQITAVIGCRTGSPLWQAAGAMDLERMVLPEARNVAKVMRLAHSAGCDILHAHNGRTTFMAALGALGSVPAVATQHFIDPAHTLYGGLAGRVMGLAHRRVNRRLSKIICVSEAVREALLKREKLAETKVRTIPNGIAQPEPPSPEAVEAIRVEFDLSPERPLVVCVSRLEQEKNVECLVGAMREVVQRRPEALCLIAGDGSQMESLRAQASAAGLDHSVVFAGFRSDALALMALSHCVVLPSRAEPFGLVLAEAMAMGKAVVAANAGGPREIVVEGKTGFLVPPSDSAALAQALMWLLDDDSLRVEMGERGRQRFLSHYTAGRMAEATAEVYREVLRKPQIRTS